jgi:hypothetical protein
MVIECIKAAKIGYLGKKARNIYGLRCFRFVVYGLWFGVEGVFASWQSDPGRTKSAEILLASGNQKQKTINQEQLHPLFLSSK